MTRPRAILATSCVLALAGWAGPSKPATSRATRHTSTTVTASSQSTAAQQFAAAYVRFLDGTGTASGLPDTTPTVRALASRAGAIPAARRDGTLLITALRPAVGAANSYLLTARDQAHTFYAQITLADQHSHRLVVALTPPDFVQALAPPGPPPPAPAPGSAAAQDAARLFLRSYLPWLYGQAPLHTITAATSELLAGLKTHPPRIPPTTRTLRPTVAAIAMQRHGHGWQALANISDGRETYELVLTIERTRGQWLLSNVSSTTR